MSRAQRLVSRYGILLGTLTLGSLGLTGCQVDVGGQTLPSPYYLYDDVQYFPAGPEFKLTNEAAAMKAFAAEETLGPAAVPSPPVPALPAVPAR